MNEEIFRQKSLDKIKSPESLDDYIRVSNPGVWLLLVSVIILLAGACAWGIFGHIDSTVEADIRAGDGAVICYVPADHITSVNVGMTVNFDNYEAEIAAIGQKEGDIFVCTLDSDSQIPDGIYNGKIIKESISPLSLILN